MAEKSRSKSITLAYARYTHESGRPFERMILAEPRIIEGSIRHLTTPYRRNSSELEFEIEADLFYTDGAVQQLIRTFGDGINVKNEMVQAQTPLVDAVRESRRAFMSAIKTKQRKDLIKRTQDLYSDVAKKLAVSLEPQFKELIASYEQRYRITSRVQGNIKNE